MTTNDNYEDFEPAFDFSTNECCVCIDSGEGELIHNDGQKEACDVEVYVQFLPAPRIIFRGQSSGKFDKLKYKKRVIDGFTCNFSINVPPPEGKLPCSWEFVSSEPVVIVGDNTTQMHEVIFHLFNSTNLPSMLRLQSDEVILAIESLPETKDRIERINKTGETLLTHVGQIKSLDKRELSGEEARNHIEAIRFFLSFLIGAWCNPVCPVGLNKNREHVWKLGISPQTANAKVLVLIDRHHFEQSTNKFPLFMKKWNDDAWQKILCDVLYLYLHANNGANGVDIGLVITQAATELLAYDFCVNKRKLLTADGFKKLNASDKFRLLFSTLNIPLEIPDKCVTLSDLGRKRKWLDAPHTLTEIRNAFIHPGSKNGNVDIDSYHEAWRLGLRYLELSIWAILD